MNTKNAKNESNLHIAMHYYNAMLAKDFDTMASYLHDDVHFISPLVQMQGKEAVILAAKNLSQILDNIEIRAQFANDDQIMLAYDFLFHTLNLNLRSAVLMDFKNAHITKIELFFDGGLLQQKKAEIFSQK